MTRYLCRRELLWTVILSLMMWNIGLTYRSVSQPVVTIDMAKVVRVAAQQLSDVSEGEGLEIAKNKLAHRLRSAVQAYALRNKAFVVDVSTIIAGETRDITEEVIKEVKR